MSYKKLYKKYKAIEDIEQADKLYITCGFVAKIRDHGKIIFLELRQRDKFIQIVCEKAFVSTKLWQKIKGLTKESAICVKGITRRPITKLSKHLHKLELHVKGLEIYSKAKSLLPFEIDSSKRVEPKIRFDYRWLDLRDYKKQLIFEVWTELEYAFSEFLRRKGFIQIHTPKLMPVASEGQDELFYLDYFGKKAYLAQSAQFYKQMAIASGFEKVFHIGPVFRANKAFTTRHDTEFTQFDVEMAWIDYHDLMELEEQLLVFILRHIKQKLGKKIKRYYGVKIDIPTLPFPRLQLVEVKNLLKSVDINARKQGDLSPEEERAIAKIIKEKYGHDFVFITHYPKNKRAFYHMAEPDNPKIAAGFDLIYKGLEITTGSSREHRLKLLKQYARQKGEDLKALKYYFEFFKYGMPSHGGFGFGPSRFIKQLLALPHVKEATFLPRLVNRLVP